MHKIFIDGEHGTTGLQIYNRLQNLDNIEIISIDPENYKDIENRLKLMKEADVGILCLPDSASREIVAKLNDDVKLIDCSTAFRTDENWVYGFPELTKGQEALIKNAKRVSNPGCYATGALSLIRPLIDSGLLSCDAYLNINAISGYSGGGKKLIEQMENEQADDYIKENYFTYALQLAHKHNAEIQKHAKLKHVPIFTPSVARFKQGMLVNIGIYLDNLNKTCNIEDIYNIFLEHYERKPNIIITPLEETQNLQKLNPEDFARSDKIQIYIFGNSENRTVNLCAAFDNLGKGAAGAAIQNLKLML